MTKRIRKNAPHGATHFCQVSMAYWREECPGYMLKWDSSRWVYAGCGPRGMIDLRGSGKTVLAVVGILSITFILWAQSCS